jgi:hypothetical protein
MTTNIFAHDKRGISPVGAGFIPAEKHNCSDTAGGHKARPYILEFLPGLEITRII